MSGPKVVRVVTREELVAAGESLLRRLDAALSEWNRASASTGAGPADQKLSKDRRDALEQMLRADRFGEFGVGAVAEIDFLDADAARRREKAAQARAQERARLVSGQELARVLLRQASADAQSRPELEKAAAGGLGLQELDAILARARQTLFKPAAAQVTANQQTLAARLAGGERSEMDLDAWRQKLVGGSARLEALLGHVCELELLGEASRAAALQKEVMAAAAVEEESVRGMRLDSLVIALKKAKDETVARERLRHKAGLVAAELSRLADVAAADALKASAASASEELEKALGSAERRLKALQDMQVAAARRSAVLEGLEKLGYQVQEELSTATSTGGRLVVRNPAAAGYGVEIAAGAGMERLQVRAVAFDANRDASGDIPAEQRWCDDFGAFKGVLKAKGSEVIVEKALRVGEAPMKLLASGQVAEERRAAAQPRQTMRRT